MKTPKKQEKKKVVREEEKRISRTELILREVPGNIKDKIADLLEEYRNWLLGGETFQWSYHEDATTLELVLTRW